MQLSECELSITYYPETHSNMTQSTDLLHHAPARGILSVQPGRWQHPHTFFPYCTQSRMSEMKLGTSSKNSILGARSKTETFLLLVCRMMGSAGFPAAVKQQVSPSIANLLVALLEEAQQQDLPVTPNWLKSGCNLLLRALTRTDAFSTNPQLPLLPEDALKVLTWIDENLAAKDVSSREEGRWYTDDAHSNGNAAKGAAGAGSDDIAAGVTAIKPSSAAAAVRGTGSAVQLLEKDDKLYLLASKLAVTAFADSSSSNGGHLGSGGGSSSMVKRAKDLAMLARLLSWSSNLVKGALERLINMQGELNISSTSLHVL